MLQIPKGASEQLRTTLETINFLMVLSDGTVCEVSSSGNPAVLYRMAENTIVVHYYGRDPRFTQQIAEAVHGAGLTPLKISSTGLHFYIVG